MLASSGVAFKAPRALRITSQPWICASCRRAYSDSAAPAPPLLLRLRNDLKTAMRAKDTQRLNVLKGILADVTNASKTSKPIETDMDLLSVLRKRASAAQDAIASFQQSGRADLTQAEQQQKSILDEYAGGVDTMSVEEITKAVSDLITTLRASTPSLKSGEVMKQLFKEGGVLAGKAVEKRLVPSIIKQALEKA